MDYSKYIQSIIFCVCLSGRRDGTDGIYKKPKDGESGKACIFSLPEDTAERCTD